MLALAPALVKIAFPLVLAGLMLAGSIVSRNAVNVILLAFGAGVWTASAAFELGRRMRP